MHTPTSEQQLMIFRSSRDLLRLQKTGNLTPETWEQLVVRLRANGLCETRIHSVIAGLHDHLRSAPASPKLRILHPVEQELISTEAWGVLLEAIQLGMIEHHAADDVLEQIAQRARLPIAKENLELGLANRWHGALSAETETGQLPS